MWINSRQQFEGSLSLGPAATTRPLGERDNSDCGILGVRPGFEERGPNRQAIPWSVFKTVEIEQAGRFSLSRDTAHDK